MAYASSSPFFLASDKADGSVAGVRGGWEDVLYPREKSGQKINWRRGEINLKPL